MNKANQYDAPIFVMGTGRCGLTPLMDVIAYHKDLAWPSQYLNRPYLTNKLFLAYLSRIADWRIFNSSKKHTSYFFPKHSEATILYNSCFNGFSSPYRDLRDDDVTSNASRKFKIMTERIIKYQDKKRFIAEYSGWSRIGFLKNIFPKAVFIHIVRDGRAVANSLINVDYWNGWGGTSKWLWGEPPLDYKKILDDYDYSFLALAAIQWKMTLNNIRSTSKLLDGNNFLEIRYEDLVKNPDSIAKKCLKFLNLDIECKIFKNNLKVAKIFDANKTKFRIRPWGESLDSNQIDMLNKILEKELGYYNYT